MGPSGELLVSMIAFVLRDRERQRKTVITVIVTTNRSVAVEIMFSSPVFYNFLLFALVNVFSSQQHQR